MIDYQQHLAFLDRELDRAWARVQECIAERQGMMDALEFGEAVREYTDARQRERYQLGVQIGRIKLLVEQSKVTHEQTECQSD